MKRVLLVDPSGRGGITVYTDQVARALLEAGAEPHLLAGRDLELSAADYRVKRWIPPLSWGRPEGSGAGFYGRRIGEWAGWALAVEAAIRIVRPDLVHFQAPVNRRLDSRLIRRVARRLPVVWTAHDVLPHEGDAGDAARFAAIYRAATLVVVHSTPAAEAVRRLAGVEPVVIKQPVEDVARSLTAAEARRRLGLPAEERVLAAVGFVREYKGYELLAEVWERLGDAAPTLLVAGELMAQSERPVLDRLARAPTVRVREGYLPEEELRATVTAADAVLLPYSAGSDSGVLHLARSLGVPVIASDAPQLAASVVSTRAGAVLPRNADTWAVAVLGELPPPPPPPPPLRVTGAAHVEAYDEAVALQRGPAPRATKVLAYTDAKERGGAEESLATLVGALGSDLDLSLMGVDREVMEWIAARRPGVTVTLVPVVRGKFHLRAIAAHLRAIRRVRPDILHVNLRIPWACQYAVLAGLLTPGVKVVAVEQLVVPPSGRVQRALKRMASRRLYAHVAVGEAVAREVERIIDLPAGSVLTVWNSVADRPLDPPQVPGHGPLIGTLGRFTRQKGLDVLVKALAELPGVTAVLVGDGEEREGLERLSDEIGVADRVIVTGWVANARDWLPNLDVFVLPSRWEAFPHAVVEAMLAERPIVATDVGSVGEAVIDAETGLLVGAEDASALAAEIRRLLSDPALAHQLAARARTLALERFNPERMAASFEAIYRSGDR